MFIQNMFKKRRYILIIIISKDFQETILEIEVIRNDSKIKQVNEVFVAINRSHISFQNTFT